MNQIKCPNCGEVFTIDESNYESIVKQVRDHQFDEEIKRREKDFEEKLKTQIALTKTEAEALKQKSLNDKEKEIEDLKNQLENIRTRNELETKQAIDKVKAELNEKEKEIVKLNTDLSNKETESKLLVTEAVTKKDKEIEDLKNRLKNINTENELVTKEALEVVKAELVEKEKEITRLNGNLAAKDAESKLMISEAVAKKDQEISELKTKSIAEEESYKKQLEGKDEMIAYYRDFKAKQSTKMIGEDLEQHCLYEFNKIRPLFKNAYFEKDNDISKGSKGDFIFRDFDDDGTEIVSIMFEMKNEADETSAKHKNEDFIAKLDKDRKNKNCEYAVLVSLLEMDNDMFNEGIVDMSHRYEKMYVVRPQNFISIITLLRNANLNSLGYKRQLIVAQNQDMDYKNFESNMNAFKTAFSKNYELASRKFQDAIDDIDRTIKALEKTKADLLSSDRNLRLANDKAQDLSIKKLTKNAPSIAEKFNNKE